MIFLKSKKRFIGNILIILGIFSLLFVLGADQIYASVGSTIARATGLSIDAIGAGAIIFLVKVVAALLQLLIGSLIKLAALLIGVAIKFNSSLAGGLGSNSFVVTGWGIFRNLANLGFVFGIIVIAIATILRVQAYQARSILWKLIVAALLVNFSLVIVGSMISVADVFSNYFQQSISANAGVGGAIQKIADSFKYNLVTLKGEVSGDNSVDTSRLDSISKDSIDIVSLIIKVLIGAGMTLVLLAIALLLFIRYFYLTFLIIISPIVLLLWIFPSTKEYWNKWWSTLIKWLLFAPINLLFIWLALSVGNSMDSIISQASQSLGPNTDLAGLALKDLVASITSGVLLIAGLKISLSMGLVGSETIMRGANKVGDWSKTKARRGAARAGRVTMGSKAGSAVQKGITRFGSTTAGKILGVGYLAQATKGAQANLTKKSQAYIEEQKSRFENIKNSDELVSLIPTMSPEQRASAMEVLADRGDLGKIKNVDDVYNSVISLKRVGRMKGASDIEKKFGMTADMIRSLKSKGEKIEVTRGNEKKMMDFNELAREFYGGFSESDWKNVAKAQGNTIYDTKKEDILGLSKEQSLMYRNAHTENTIRHAGNAIGNTASQLKGDQLKNYYEEVIRTATGGVSLGTVEEEYEEEVSKKGAGFEQAGTQKVKEKKTRTVDAQAAINKALDEGDLDGAIRVMSQSKDENVKRAASRLKKRMGSFVAMMSSEEGGEKPSESKATGEKKA